MFIDELQVSDLLYSKKHTDTFSNVSDEQCHAARKQDPLSLTIAQ